MHFSSIIPGNSQSWVEIWYGDDRIGPPTPLIEWGQEYQQSENGETVLGITSVTLKGTWINSPSGTYNEVYAAQQQLLDIFSEDKKHFSLRAGAANTLITPGEYIASGMYPVIESIALPSDLQYDKFTYTVSMRVDDDSIGNSGLLKSKSNQWTFAEDAEKRILNITHSISIVGNNSAISGQPNNAHTNARDYGVTLLGPGKVPAGFPAFTQQGDSGLYEISSTRTESVDVERGSYDASETFVVGSGTYPWNDARKITITTDRNDITTVQVAGTVQGFGRTNIAASGSIGFDNAVSGWINHVQPALYADAVAFYEGLGITLNLNPKIISKSNTESEFLGTVDYSISYTDDPADNLPSGISERSVTVDRQDPIELMARFTIPFRSLGSIVQEMGTPLDGSININATARATNTGDEIADVNRAIAQVESDLNAVKPDPTSSEFIRLDLSANPSLNYSPKTLTASASLQYTFILDLAGVNSASGSISLPRYQGGL